jgi:hypothetical protein
MEKEKKWLAAERKAQAKRAVEDSDAGNRGAGPRGRETAEAS